MTCGALIKVMLVGPIPSSVATVELRLAERLYVEARLASVSMPVSLTCAVTNSSVTHTVKLEDVLRARARAVALTTGATSVS